LQGNTQTRQKEQTEARFSCKQMGVSPVLNIQRDFSWRLCYNYHDFNKLSGGIIMDDLAKQVKHDMLRTLIWIIIAMSAAIATVYLAW
jgi:hypothetical protein